MDLSGITTDYKQGVTNATNTCNRPTCNIIITDEILDVLRYVFEAVIFHWKGCNFLRLGERALANVLDVDGVCTYNFIVF